MQSYKKIYFVIIFFCFISLSYKGLSQNIITNVVIKGKLIDAPNDPQIENISELSSFYTYANTAIKIDNNNEFTYRFYLNKATYFRIGRNILYIYPNDSLQFIINFKDPSMSKFPRDRTGINEYLKNTPLPKMGSFLIGGDKVTDDLKETIDTILKIAAHRKAHLIKFKKINKEFFNLETGRINSDIINSLIYLEFYFPLVNKITTSEIETFKSNYRKIISPYFDKISKELLDPKYLQLTVYRNILYILLERNPSFRNNAEIAFWIKSNEILEDIFNEANKSSLSLVKIKISKLPNNKFKPLLFKYVENKLSYNNGDVALPFYMYDTKEQRVKLDSFKGKIIYLTFWATWCKPCIAEMPLLDSVKNYYRHSNEIIFLSLSIDEDKNKWTNFMKQSIYSKNQFHVKKKELELYRIFELPRAMIINKKFEISDLYAPQPTSPEFTKKIDSLLKKNL